MASLPQELIPLPEQTQPEPPMDEAELVSILRQHEANAIGYEPGGEDSISAEIALALDYYYGIMDDVPSAEGTSKVTDRTVQTVVDNALAALLRPFASASETVMFVPRGPEDIEVAEQATEYCNYVFQCDNPGFLILHNWFKDALLSKLGVLKVYWEEDPQIVDERVVDLASIDPEMAMLARASEHYLGEQDGMAFFGRRVDNGRVRVENVPPEEFRIRRLSRDVEGSYYVAHVPRDKTRSDLVEMGFDADIVDDLPASTDHVDDNEVKRARYRDENLDDNQIDTPHHSQDIVALRDEYVRVDYDGDGVAELRRVLRVEDVILLNEEVEEIPFPTICPVPMPHKVFGLSLADLVIEPQRINTVLWRQMLDNLYKSNNPRPVIGAGAERDDGSTADTISDNAPGAEILVKDRSQFDYAEVPYTAANSAQMLEIVGQSIEQRTGIGRAGQGLDVDALKKSGQMTATEIAMIADGKSARVEMIARIFAETGMTRLFELIYALVVRHQPQERVIRLRNKWVPVDPSAWPEMDVRVSVGLGIGDKAERNAIADSVLEIQAELVQSPFAGMVSAENVYNALRYKLNAAGIKNVEEYITSTEDMPEQEDQPDPEMARVQVEAQLQAAKLQGEQQLSALKLEQQREEAALKLQLQREEAAAEIELARDKAAAEMALAEQRMAFEQRLAEQRQQFAEEQSRELSKNRPGGDLDK